jgi:drug/metabolite transporter (DMT)-like permease
MLLLCCLWGMQQVAAKVAMPVVTPIWQSGIRSLLALIGLSLWAAWRRQPLWQQDTTVPAGLVAGSLFAIEFALLFLGLTWSSASRMVLFLYLGPCLTVLGLHFWVPGEHMRGRQFAGVALAFLGVLIAFSDRAGSAHELSWLGDLCGILAAVAWAATTVWIRATSLARINAGRVLGYQLAVSTVTLLPLAALVEPDGFRLFAGWSEAHPLALLSLVYQGLIVAFASYLTWFWLLTRYLAGRLAVFSFLTPLFGVSFGVLLLGDVFTPAFAVAVAGVVGGIVLVNWPGKAG